MKKCKNDLFTALLLFAAFTLWTFWVITVDVRPIGPLGSTVGLATLNAYFHRLTGIHIELYELTDWLSLIPIGFVFGFAFLGLFQWIQRRHIFKVDRSILILGGFYAMVMAAFLFFEEVAINHRPILIDGVLEASYPSSTTMLVLCVMPTAAAQLRARIKNNFIRRSVCTAITLFSLFMVICRLLSGVHWFSDIIGGVLLSAALIRLYSYLAH